jgi:hypothetical protein
MITAQAISRGTRFFRSEFKVFTRYPPLASPRARINTMP